MITIIAGQSESRYMVQQLIDDRADFSVAHDKKRIEIDFHKPDGEVKDSNFVTILVRPECACTEPCPLCKCLAYRAINNAHYQLGEALSRAAPYNSTDDY